MAFLKLDLGGTIFDQNKFNLGTDGNGYLSLINQITDNPPYYPPADSGQNFKVRMIGR